jgi:DNA-binding response OmpR family regulator
VSLQVAHTAAVLQVNQVQRAQPGAPLGLPDISGVQAALRIRRTSKGRKLTLIALTGLGRDEDRFLTQAAQFDEHLVKPLQMSDLDRIIATVAKGRETAGAGNNM